MTQHYQHQFQVPGGGPIAADVALDHMRDLLSAAEWDSSTIEGIADLLVRTGRTIREPDDETPVDRFYELLGEYQPINEQDIASLNDDWEQSIEGGATVLIIERDMYRCVDYFSEVCAPEDAAKRIAASFTLHEATDFTFHEAIDLSTGDAIEPEMTMVVGVTIGGVDYTEEA